MNDCINHRLRNLRHARRELISLIRFEERAPINLPADVQVRHRMKSFRFNERIIRPMKTNNSTQLNRKIQFPFRSSLFSSSSSSSFPGSCFASRTNKLSFPRETRSLILLRRGTSTPDQSELHESVIYDFWMSRSGRRIE